MKKLEKNFNKLESLEKFQLKKGKMNNIKAGNTIAERADWSTSQDTCECTSGNCVMEVIDGRASYVSGNWVED